MKVISYANPHKEMPLLMFSSRSCMTSTIYTARCKVEGVTEHHWAIPCKLKKERDAEAEKKVRGDSGTIVAAKGFTVIPAYGGLEKFSKEQVLEHTTKFIICTDQVSLLYHTNIQRLTSSFSPLLQPTISSIVTILLPCVHSPKARNWEVCIRSLTTCITHTYRPWRRKLQRLSPWLG